MSMTFRKRRNARPRRTNKKRLPTRRGKKRVSLTLPIVYGRIHATWCGHCTAMANDWERLNQTILKNHSGIQRFDIESEEKDDKMNQFTNRYQSSLTNNGYPTIYKLYTKGGSVEYYESGDRSENAIRKWLLSMSNRNM